MLKKLSARLLIAVLLLFPVSAQAANTDIATGQAVKTIDTTATGTMPAQSNVVTINVNGAGTVNVELSGTWVGTVTFQAKVKNTFYNILASPVGGGTAVATATANGAWTINAGGYSAIQTIFTTRTSGTPTVDFRANASTSAIVCVTGCSGSGGGSTTVTYNTTPPTLTNGQTAPLQSDANGNLKVTQAGPGTTSGAPLYATDPNNNTIAQDSSKNQGVYLNGSGHGTTSGDPLYSTDPNATAINLDANKNTIVVGTGPNNALTTMRSYSNLEIQGSNSVSTTAVSLSFANAYYEMSIMNTGASAAYCNPTTTATATLTGGILLPANMTTPFILTYRTSGASTLSCITISGTTTVQGIAYH